MAYRMPQKSSPMFCCTKLKIVATRVSHAVIRLNIQSKTILMMNVCDHCRKRPDSSKQHSLTASHSSRKEAAAQGPAQAASAGLSSARSQAAFPTAKDLGIDVSAYDAAHDALAPPQAAASPAVQSSSMGNTGARTYRTPTYHRCTQHASIMIVLCVHWVACV